MRNMLAWLGLAPNQPARSWPVRVAFMAAILALVVIDSRWGITVALAVGVPLMAVIYLVGERWDRRRKQAPP